MKSQAPKTPWQHYKSVATWIPVDVFDRLQAVAKLDNVSASAYIKAIIIDAVEEQENLLASKSAIVGYKKTTIIESV